MPTTESVRKRKDLLPVVWESARRFYVEGAIRNAKPFWPTVREVAQVTGLNAKTLQTTVKRDGWDADRKAYQADREKAFDDELRRRAEHEGRQLAEFRTRFDLDCAAAAAAAIAKAQEGLHNLSMELEEITDKDGNPTGKVRLPRGAATNLNQLTTAMANAQKVGRLAAGESTENMSVRAQDLTREDESDDFDWSRLSVEARNEIEGVWTEILEGDDEPTGPGAVSSDEERPRHPQAIPGT